MFQQTILTQNQLVHFLRTILCCLFVALVSNLQQRDGVCGTENKLQSP